MPYKVFFVEDEIVTREGIRDNVDWKAFGFEFCGDAADGEMALPLVRAAKPDVLITDIKMPFMDGLQLAKIVRERMPGVKIVILSGHDEFEYAQKAIELGVTEYLLKPVTVHNLQQTLQKIATQLDRERADQENQHKLREQIEENQSLLKEKLLLRLIVGAISASDAIAQGQSLGMDLSAHCYRVVILKTELDDRSEAFDYSEYEHAREIVQNLVENNPDVFLFSKDWDELILLMKGNLPEHLEEDKDLLLAQIQKALGATRYRLAIGIGAIQRRIADISLSFVEALAKVHNTAGVAPLTPAIIEQELLKMDKSACDNYMRCGSKEEIAAFFNDYLSTLNETALKSPLLKNYVFVDVVCAAVKLIEELGGEVNQVIPELNTIETTLTQIHTLDQLKEQVLLILSAAITFRDSRASSQYIGMIRQAKNYIEQHYMDPDLSLSAVAAHVNLSPSHFSMVFSQECAQTFKDFLTEVRIKKARQLLRTTSLRAIDIARQVGYNDPHYFSAAFKKNTDLSPTEFRAQKKED